MGFWFFGNNYFISRNGKKHTMVCDDNVEPPMFARAGAVRWISKKVVMNGAEIWAAFFK